MRMVRGPTPVFDSQAFLAIVGSEKTILKPMRIQHDIDSSDSLFSAQLHAPGSAELVNKASLKYFPLQVHFSLRTLPESRELVSQVTNSCFSGHTPLRLYVRGFNHSRVNAANSVSHAGITEWSFRSLPPFLAGVFPPRMPGFTG